MKTHRATVSVKTATARPSASLIARKAAARMVVKTGIRAAAEASHKNVG